METLTKEQCHTFAEINGKYFCKTCGIDSRTAEIDIMNKEDKGVCYAFPKDNMIGGWADKLYCAHYGCEWCSNMGDIRQAVYWTINGQKYSGTYYKSNSDIIRWRKVKS